MPDQIFKNPRLAEIYDAFDGERNDLQLYLSIAKELKAKSVLDVGCGTGCFAQLLSNDGFDIIGLDPAEASLRIARQKPGAENVKWILGNTSQLPRLNIDLAVMTGNVAQVFITDELWEEALKSIHKTLQPLGHLVFEVRDPSKKAWLDWTEQKTFKQLELPEIGLVKGRCNVTNVSNDLVSFCWTYTFESSGETIKSDSTLKFRQKDDIVRSLEKTGYLIQDVRDAPDRPGKEFVFIASKRVM